MKQKHIYITAAMWERIKHYIDVKGWKFVDFCRQAMIEKLEKEGF